MQALKCDVCGAALKMHDSGQYATCEYCGMIHSLDRVRAKVQEIRGSVEVTKGEAEKERILKNAETNLSLGLFDRAEEAYLTLTREFPQDWRGWEGLTFLPVVRYNAEGTVPTVERLIKSMEYQRVAKKLKPDLETEARWDMFFDSFGFELGVEEALVPGDYRGAMSRINDFQAHVICSDTSRLTDDLLTYHELICTQYKVLFQCGNLFPFACSEVDSLYPLWPEGEGVESKKCATLQELAQEGIVYARIVQGMPAEYRVRFVSELGIKNFAAQNDSIHFILGRTIVYYSGYGEYYRSLRSAVKIDYDFVRGALMRYGVCLSCGGTFSGVFRKACSRCGRPKNY